MKKPYQIETLRAVKRLEEMSADGNPTVQMVLPMAEMVGWLHKGVGELVRQAGQQLIQLLMEEEVKHLVGERSRATPERTANRWGSERGYCVVMGQKVPVERPRVRSTEDREIRLGSYEMFHRGEPLTETVWEKLMLGLTTRKYGDAVRQFTEAYGLEKSAVSEHFIEASGDLMNRGFDFTESRLYVLDGGKALHAAVKKYAGESAPMQRCQVHKRRNVLDHITDENKPIVAHKLNAAYAMEDYAAARQALDGLHRELMHLNPSAARSLAEGLEETLTVHRLHVPQQLRMTLASTNVIESAFSIVETVCRNVKRWHGGDHRERWVGSGLLIAEKQFRRVRGHKQIPVLIRALETLKPSSKQVVTKRKAS
jgi:transposase-like protein